MSCSDTFANTERGEMIQKMRGIRFSDSLWKRTVKAARKLKTTASELVRVAVIDYLHKKEKGEFDGKH